MNRHCKAVVMQNVVYGMPVIVLCLPASSSCATLISLKNTASSKAYCTYE